MAQPELGSGEFEHGEEVGGVFFVLGGEASEVFDAIEEPLDAVARAIEYRAEAGFSKCSSLLRSNSLAVWRLVPCSLDRAAIPESSVNLHVVIAAVSSGRC
jgi:hypothetical protein